MASKPAGDWGEYRALILDELKRLNLGIEGLREKIDEMHTSEIASIKAQIAVLQFKSGIWGFMAGAIPSIAAAVYVVLHKAA